VKIGIFTVLYNDKPLEDVLKYVSSIGYEAVELAAWKASAHLDIDKVLSGGAGEVKNLIEKYGMVISALSNHLEGQLVLGPHGPSTDDWFKGTPEEKSRYGVERMKKTIEAAAQLDVGVVNSFTGCPNWSAWYIFPPAYEKIWEGFYEQFREKWAPILDHAKEHSVKIAFETHPQEINYNVETAKQLLKSVDDHPALGFNYDPSHLLWQQMDPVVFIYELGSRIFHVHAKDVETIPHQVARTGVLATGAWNRIARPVRFRTIGWGMVPWRRVITALLEVGYDYVMSVEHEDPTFSRDSGVEQTVACLKPLLKVKPPEVKPWW